MSIGSLLKSFVEETIYEATPDLKFVEKDAGGISMKGVLSRARSKYLREKEVWRVGKTFSPSTITYSYCRRLKVAQLAEKKDLYYERFPPHKQNNFDIGNMYHELIQGWFWDAGILKGTFRCHICEKSYPNLVSPTKCPEGHSRKVLEYMEITYTNEEYKLKGRADGLVVVEEGRKHFEDHLIDIKSISGRTVKTPAQQFCFEDLETDGPKDINIIQITLYMFLSQKIRAHLIYINKNDGKIKSFAIPYNQDLIQPYLDEIEDLIKKAELYKQGKLGSGELPKPCGKKDCPCEQFTYNT